MQVGTKASAREFSFLFVCRQHVECSRPSRSDKAAVRRAGRDLELWASVVSKLSAASTDGTPEGDHIRFVTTERSANAGSAAVTRRGGTTSDHKKTRCDDEASNPSDSLLLRFTRNRGRCLFGRPSNQHPPTSPVTRLPSASAQPDVAHLTDRDLLGGRFGDMTGCWPIR